MAASDTIRLNHDLPGWGSLRKKRFLGVLFRGVFVIFVTHKKKKKKDSLRFWGFVFFLDGSSFLKDFYLELVLMHEKGFLRGSPGKKKKRFSL